MDWLIGIGLAVMVAVLIARSLRVRIEVDQGARPSHPSGRACSPDPSPEQDAALARDALASGDVPHALHHAVCALAAEPSCEEWRELLRKVLKNADDPLALLPAPPGQPIFYGTAAARAVALHQAGRHDEALRALFEVQLARPAKEFLPWADEWLARPGVAKQVQAEATLGWFLASWGHGTEDPAHLARALRVAEAATTAYPEHPHLLTIRCGLMRRAGDLDGSLAVAKAAFERDPGYGAAVSLATAYRAKGDLPRAVEHFRRAAELEPGDPGSRLDLGDTLIQAGKLEEAARPYEEVLALKVGHPWAHASLVFLRCLAGDVEAQQELLGLARAGNPRAQELGAELARRKAPWVGYLPPPGDVTAGAWRQLVDMARKGKTPTGMKLELSHLEAPSNSLIPILLRRRGLDISLTINVKQVSTPDPRQPRGAVDPLLWTFDGTTPRVAVGPPSPDVLAAVAGLAAKPFALEPWWEAAGELARSLGPGRAAALQAVMVHPPDAPDDGVAAWIQAVQLAAALVIARLDEGWAGTRRREVLLSLLRGPVDWTVEAAFVALARVAIDTPEARTEARNMIGELIEGAPRDGDVCYLYALAVCGSRIPGLSERDLKTLADLRAQQERR